MNYVKYQQGDVVMYKVDDTKFEDNVKQSEKCTVNYTNTSNDSAILAFGEATGHKHQINMKDMLEEAGVTLHLGYNGRAGVDVPEGFQITGTTVKLTHEEHDAIELPPGKYVLRIVREFDHIAGRSGYVAD